MVAESAQTLQRGLRLLRLLAEDLSGRTPTELAISLEVSRPAVYRLVNALQDEGFVRRDSDGRVYIGFGVLQLARVVQPMLRAVALPVLRRLAEEVGATAHLTVAEGDEGLAMAVVEPSWTDMHVAYREGARHALTKGAAGLAILAGREGRVSPSYQTSRDQLQDGAQGIAAAVRGLSWLEASVGVVTFMPLDVDTVAPRVVEAAGELRDAVR